MMLMYISALLKAVGESMDAWSRMGIVDDLNRRAQIDAWLRTNGGIDAWWSSSRRGVICCQVNPKFTVEEQLAESVVMNIRAYDGGMINFNVTLPRAYAKYIASCVDENGQKYGYDVKIVIDSRVCGDCGRSLRFCLCMSS